MPWNEVERLKLPIIKALVAAGAKLHPRHRVQALSSGYFAPNSAELDFMLASGLSVNTGYKDTLYLQVILVPECQTLRL